MVQSDTIMSYVQHVVGTEKNQWWIYILDGCQQALTLAWKGE